MVAEPPTLLPAITLPAENSSCPAVPSRGLSAATGTMEYAHGSIFTGTWEKGWWQGPGKLVTGDGVVYEGNYDRGRLYGPGYVTYPDGPKYSGVFTNGKLTGGVRVFEDQMNVPVERGENKPGKSYDE